MSLMKDFVSSRKFLHNRSVGEILNAAGKAMQNHMKKASSFGQWHHGIDDVAFQCATFSLRDEESAVTMNVLVFFTDDKGNAIRHE